MRKILVLRFSAMGDVALLVPAVKSLVAAYPDVEITVVTRPKFGPLFFDIARVNVFPADVDYTYTGVFGMRDLFRKLMRKGPYDIVFDMHDHMRTIILRSLFKLFGTKVIVFEKGRAEKKARTLKENKVVSPLIHTVERYRQGFAKGGFSFDFVVAPYLSLGESIQNASEWFAYKKSAGTTKWVGIAPFAMHKSKIWPLENYPKLMELLLAKSPVTFFLFGGGDKEIKCFESLKQKFPQHCEVIAGQLKLRQEIALMRHLDVMLCVDSSNMHLAALSGIPLVSIWGGTHPDLGFGPFNYSEENILQISRDELSCRPCSTYGRETCYRGDFACLNRISPEAVVQKILQKIE